MISVPIHLVRYETPDGEPSPGEPSPGEPDAGELDAGEIVPWFLDRRDVPWLRDLIELFEAFVGAPRHALEARLRRPPEAQQFRLVVHVLWQVYATRIESSVSPRQARATLFRAAAMSRQRSEALATAVRTLGVDGEQLLAALFADLPEKRIVGKVASVPSPDQLALWCNTAIIKALLRRAIGIRLEVSGNAHAVIRQAKLCGLICTVEERAAADACRISLSGPLSALTQTTRYGHALASWISVLPWCRTFRLEARCRMGSADTRPRRLVLTKGSPIEPGGEPRRFDSALEARFARDFVRATRAWTLVREPEPVVAADKLIFPDFEIRKVADPSCRWWIEIVGFWTPQYLAQKTTSLRAARLDRLILCVDRARACDFTAAPELARVVWFRRVIDVAYVLGIVDLDG